MEFDIFFSISQTPAPTSSPSISTVPSEAEMFDHFFSQVEAADRLGFGVAWVAESHLSSDVQKRHRKPVIPHWKGEVGLNTDILQLAQRVFATTQKIEVGSAVMNILCNGGPIAHAERVSTFCTLHGLNPKERRRLHIGFAAGRFDFINRASGIVPRSPLEELIWPTLKGKIFSEAAEIFVRLLQGETLCSEDISCPGISQDDFRSPGEWKKFVEVAQTFGIFGSSRGEIELTRRWNFEVLQIVPKSWRRELLQLTIGSHEPRLQKRVNLWAPVQVFNLSITAPEVIEDTHLRMTTAYNAQGGAWKRSFMPRTVFVFINEESGLSPEERSQRARAESKLALEAYWTALEGTLDPERVREATHNALVGNAQEIKDQILARYHPEDRLMLWFDFFNHDCERVISNMEAFMNLVAPSFKHTSLPVTS